MRIRTLAAVPLAAPIVALVFSGVAQAAPTRLVGTVGPGFTISLTTASGKPVTSLNAGRYTIAVNDDSPVHNFHLTGPGVNKATAVAATGKTVWTITLKRGRYHFQCDPHKAFMKGNFSVK